MPFACRQGCKHALSPEHVKWALKDKQGIGSGINPKTGKPNKHLKEVRNALNGAINNMKIVKKTLGDPKLNPEQRVSLEKDLYFTRGEIGRFLCVLCAFPCELCG